MTAITVLMSVYNAQDIMSESIESILAQTHADFEFLIIDDGSTDDTPRILAEYAARDPRIRVMTQSNTGLTKALNNGLKEAKGRYIARQDADDPSVPERLAMQFDYMEAQPDIALLGGNSVDILPDGSQKLWGYHTPEKLQKITFRQTPFPHSTVMMRRDVCLRLGGYDERYLTAQDCELWMRFAKKAPIAMLEKPLISRHMLPGSISAQKRWRQFYDATRARITHNKGLGKITALLHSALSLLINLWTMK